MYLILDVIWTLESFIALLFSAINLTYSIHRYLKFIIRGTNGTQRLNELTYIWAEAPCTLFLFAALLFGLDALIEPMAGKSTKLFFFAVTIIYLTPAALLAKTIYFMQHRDVFTRNAKRIDTGSHRFPAEIMKKKDDPIKVLGVYPHHKQGIPLDLAGDFEALMNGLPGCDLDILMGYDISKKELLFECMRREVDVFHIASHATENDGILLSDGYIHPTALSSAILACGAKVVVLSACDTEIMAEAILQVGDVSCVVYTRTRVYDRQAIAFAGPFYRALAKGYTVKRALALGLAMLPVSDARNVWRLSGDESFKLRNKK